MRIADWQTMAYNLAKKNGFYDKPKTDVEALMLIVTEIAEAVEEIRNGTEHTRLGPTGKPEGLDIELADVALRLMDFCEHKGINLDSAMTIKHEYNCTRPYKHGKKL